MKLNQILNQYLSGKRKNNNKKTLITFSLSLFRQLNDREISNSYKFNITTKIIYKNNDYNELNKISFIHSKLVINSISSFDYGVYWCRARNVIGEAMDSIKVERKRVPDIVTNLTVTKVDTNSLTLNWLSGSNGGEHQIFLININNSFNITVPTVENPAQQNENLNESIEIKSIIFLIITANSISNSLILNFKI